MNYMKQIAQMLGVELDEEFKLELPSGAQLKRLQFTENGFSKFNFNSKKWERDSDYLEMLLTGRAKIIKKPWKPKTGDRYLFVSSDKFVLSVHFHDKNDTDTMRYQLGNCFKTEEEITPEVLEETWKRCYGKYYEEE